VKPFVVFCALTVFSSCVLPGQTVGVPARWVGTWELNVSKSIFGRILMPGVPADTVIVSQTLRLEQTGHAIRLSGETVISDKSGSRSSHDDNRLRLDGTETTAGPISLSFRPIDASTFEIVSTLNINDRNLKEVSRFSFSSDGGTLTETKTQTERETVPEGADKATGAVARTSTSLLVFSKLPER
jgi:hypothetical protein